MQAIRMQKLANGIFRYQQHYILFCRNCNRFENVGEKNFLNFLKKDKRMKYLFVQQIDFANVNYVEIRNFSEYQVILQWRI